MNIHEYQAKKLLADYGIPVPPGHYATSSAKAEKAAKTLGGVMWMIKAQVHAGGRGKAGGVKKAGSIEEVVICAQELIGKSLVTHQTGSRGQPINGVLVERATMISRELYLSFVVDRAKKRVTVITSTEGGMDIEEVAAKTPEKIVTRAIDPIVGIQGYQCREIAFALGLDDNQRKQMTEILNGLYRLFIEKDLSLLEINPLIVTQDGDLLAIDAKINLDDNALHRHTDLAALYDASQEDAKEHRAREFDLNYVALDGNIACMVNGAGLAMATMDVVKMHGGEPANFLDVGGGTTTAKVTAAFKLILSDPKVQAILVNIFGGIVKCDLIAEGVITAVRQTRTKLPVIVRLEGTRVAEGRALLQQYSKFAVITADDLDDAAKKAVAAVGSK
jgi:succinyl-CoA synthetase beta subunit